MSCGGSWAVASPSSAFSVSVGREGLAGAGFVGGFFPPGGDLVPGGELALGWMASLRLGVMCGFFCCCWSGCRAVAAARAGWTGVCVSSLGCVKVGIFGTSGITFVWPFIKLCLVIGALVTGFRREVGVVLGVIRKITLVTI